MKPAVQSALLSIKVTDSCQRMAANGFHTAQKSLLIAGIVRSVPHGFDFEAVVLSTCKKIEEMKFVLLSPCIWKL